MTKPRKPRGLQAAGTRLWTNITEEFDLDQEPHKVELLEQAARVADRIAQLDRAMLNEPMTVRGSAGQLVVHPFISEARFQRGLLSQMLARLNFAGVAEDA